MADFTERNVVLSIKVLADQTIEVERAEQVLRGGAVIASTTSIQVLTAAQDLNAFQVEPQVLAVAAAVWTPQHVVEATADMLRAMAAAHAQLNQEIDNTAVMHRQKLIDDERALADLNRSSEAVQTAMRQLQDEQAVLAQRTEQITQERQAIYDRREALRSQRKDLDQLFAQMHADTVAADAAPAAPQPLQEGAHAQ